VKAGSCSPWSFREMEGVRKRDPALCSPLPPVAIGSSSFGTALLGGGPCMYGGTGGCEGTVRGADAGTDGGADVGGEAE